MAKTIRLWLVLLVLFMGVNTTIVYAQEGGGAPGAEAPAAGEPAPSNDEGSPGFAKIVFGMGFVNLFIWILIFLTSFATIAFMIDGMLQTRREKILPPFLITGVRDALDEGDLDAAIHICETNPCQLSNILMAGFTNITEGFEVVQDSVSAATDIESERIIQRIGYLNLCGQIAPMLGLLGTVTGMVKAFDGLATAGASKDKDLALAISTALWTTVSGLLIAVPALLSFTIYKNIATTRLLESEATVLDLIKVLRGAEVDDGEEEAFEDDDYED